ncbi:MAG: MarR family winged helix-turn-helix transcriptional regulator [Gammaproteobacteria bacterium]
MTDLSALTRSTELCLRLARANAVLIRRFDSGLGSHHGISYGDFQLLNHLARAPGGRLRRVDLAERLGLTASGVTRSLLPLEKIGLVGRESDPRDARVGFAVITPTGLELVANATDVVDLISRDAMRAFAPAQLEALNEVLGQLAGLHAANS